MASVGEGHLLVELLGSVIQPEPETLHGRISPCVIGKFEGQLIRVCVDSFATTSMARWFFERTLSRAVSVVFGATTTQVSCTVVDDLRNAAILLGSEWVKQTRFHLEFPFGLSPQIIPYRCATNFACTAKEETQIPPFSCKFVTIQVPAGAKDGTYLTDAFRSGNPSEEFVCPREVCCVGGSQPFVRDKPVG